MNIDQWLAYDFIEIFYTKKKTERKGQYWQIDSLNISQFRPRAEVKDFNQRFNTR